MPVKSAGSVAVLATAMVLLSGCFSPYRSDRGALAGGVGGAGVGALVGEAVGHPGVGALVGAGVGAVSGAAVGGALDNIEANNRAQIEARIGHPVAAGAATIDDVVNMTRAGVAEDLMINHIRSHGMATPLQANDLIFLQQQRVGTRVVQAMQAPPLVAAQPMMMQPAGPPAVIVGGGYGPGPYYGPPPPYPYYRAWRP
jgi:hypothetical protein